MSSKSTPTAPKRDTIWSRLLEGRMVNGRFFARHWIPTMMAMFAVLVYVTNNYSMRGADARIKRLQNRLEVVQTESVRVRGQYMSRIRESSMRRQLDSLGLPLAIQSQPPYRLSANDTEEEK